MAETDDWYSGDVATFGDRLAGAREAAGVAGISERNLYRFRSSNKGKALITNLRNLFQKDAGWQAFLRILALARQDKNLAVAMRANEWLAAINGFTPPTKVEVSQSGAVKSPGMLIIHPDAFEKMTHEERARFFSQLGDGTQ